MCKHNVPWYEYELCHECAQEEFEDRRLFEARRACYRPVGAKRIYQKDCVLLRTNKEITNSLPVAVSPRSFDTEQ